MDQSLLIASSRSSSRSSSRQPSIWTNVYRDAHSCIYSVAQDLRSNPVRNSETTLVRLSRETYRRDRLDQIDLRRSITVGYTA